MKKLEELLIIAERVGGARYDNQVRNSRSGCRRDKSRYSKRQNIEGAGAECYICDFFGQPFDEKIYADRNDGGKDFFLNLLDPLANKTRLYSVNAVWFGYYPYTTDPKENGDLLENIIDLRSDHEIESMAEIYVIAEGSIYKNGYRISGWTTRDILIDVEERYPTIVPQGESSSAYKFWLPKSMFFPIEVLLSRIR